MAKKVKMPGRIESTSLDGIVTGAAEIYDDGKEKMQNVINTEVYAELLRLKNEKQDNLMFDNAPTEDSRNPVTSGGVFTAEKALSDAIEAILILIPSAATALNQLADKNFVNSSIATDTATFRGTSAIGLSEAQFLEWANGLTHDMNDYVFWQTIDEAGNTIFKRYKWNGTQWLYEYTLNNSSFTADQWAAIMSGITSALVEKLNGLPTNAALQQALNSKQNALSFDNVPTEGSNNPVKSGGVYSVVKAEEEARLNLAQTVSEIGGDVSQIEDVIPAGATELNQLVANASMEAYVASIIQNITSSFTLATADGHINLTLTQTNGQVSTLTLTSSDIASAQDVANLQQLYNNLQQSKPEPVTALPETGQQQGVIYRLAGTTSYSDYMWSGSTWVLMATYNNAVDPRPKKASQNLVTSGGVFDNMGALDVSELNATENPHTPAIYVNLSAAIADIPTEYQKGGMSIQFIKGTVQSSDNKYVQYRLMADEFTTDTTQWAIAEEGVYVENPEFVYVKTDKDNKILWAIKTDGGIYYGAGVPQQVVDYINEKIAELSLDEYEDIVAFLNGLEEGDKTLQTLLNEKVDKEEGKSLIDEDYASSQSAIDNTEYLQVTTDNEDKILEGIKQDGTKVIGGDLNIGGSTKILGRMKVAVVTYKVVENSEYLAAWVDAEGKIIFGFKADGKTYVGDANFLNDIESIKVFLANFSDKNIDWDALTSITATENPEFIEAKTDSEGKLLAGRTSNGAAFENVGFSTPKVSIDGATIENIEDRERRSEITTDFEGKILSYRDGDGILHEKAGIESPVVITDNLNLSNKGMLLFQQALKDSGFNPGGAGDYSGYLSNDGESPLSLPIPEFALINITNEDGNAVWPTSKTNNYVGLIEYYGMDGNFFRKPIIFNAQGNSSLGMPKRNLSIDLFDSEADGDVFSVRFGDWVPQDGFQMKAFYLDLFRCVCPISYKLARQIVRSRGPIDDAFWKREMLPVIGTGTTDMSEFTDYNKIFDSGAIGIPDGFPCIAFLNGEFYGVYSFQLKKHRDNYMMSKGNAGHIHLDGCIKDIFEYDGTINWAVVAGTVADSLGNRDGIEFRNPKNLVYAEAHNNTYKYDADSPGQFEIAGNNDGSAVYDTWQAGSYTVGKIVSHNGHIFMNTVADNTAEPIYHAKNNADDAPDFKNKTGCGWLNVTNTVAVKSSFIALSTYVPELAQMVEDHATDSEIKAKIEEYFDVKGLIDYLLLSVVVGYETAGKNWQWITYDGIKWSVCPWDYDGAFGWNGWGEISPTSNISVNTTGLDTPLGYIYAYYSNVINERYAQLRQLGIFSVDNIWGLFVRWMDAVGADYYGKDLDKWPCDGEHYSGMSGTHYDNKYRLYNWIAARIEKCDTIFEYNN